MNLKQGFEYSTFLERNIEKLIMELRLHGKDYIQTLTSKYNLPNTKETIIEPLEKKSNYSEYSFKELNLAIDTLIKEKAELIEAINTAKASINVDIDALTRANISKRKKIDTYKFLLDTLNDTKVKKDQGKTFILNVNNEQVPYIYDIAIDTTNLVEKSEIKNIINELEASTKATSENIERVILNTDITFNNLFETWFEIKDILNKVSRQEKN